jgi:uncharacterized membrane protein
MTAPVGKDQVIAFLSSVSSGMMAFTGIGFGLLFILLQFGSTAYTPHLVPILVRNRTLNHEGGVFTGTFVYSSWPFVVWVPTAQPAPWSSGWRSPGSS